MVELVSQPVTRDWISLRVSLLVNYIQQVSEPVSNPVWVREQHILSI